MRVYGTDGAHKFFKSLIMWISVWMPSTTEIAEEDVEEKALKHYSQHHYGTLVQPQNHPPASLFLVWTLELLSALNRSSYLQNTCGAPGATKVLHTCDICRSFHRAEARACRRHLNHSQTNQNQIMCLTLLSHRFVLSPVSPLCTFDRACACQHLLFPV